MCMTSSRCWRSHLWWRYCQDWVQEFQLLPSDDPARLQGVATRVDGSSPRSSVQGIVWFDIHDAHVLVKYVKPPVLRSSARSAAGRVDFECGSGDRHCSSLRITWPYHLRRAWRILSVIGATFSLFLVSLLVTWSNRVSPRLQGSMRILIACSIRSWLAAAGHHSQPNSATGRATDR